MLLQQGAKGCERDPNIAGVGKEESNVQYEEDRAQCHRWKETTKRMAKQVCQGDKKTVTQQLVWMENPPLQSLE